MDEQKPSQTLAISIGLLNLSGLGLGYLYAKKWIRWGLHFLITISLLAAAILTNFSQKIPVFLSVIGLWLLWMAFDGWRQGQKLNPEQGLFPIDLSKIQPWMLIAVPLLILCLEGVVLAGYYRLGQKEFQRGMQAYQEADCESAVNRFRRVLTIYRLSSGSHKEEADARIEECKLMLSADRSYEEGAYEDAIDGYQEYLESYSEGALSQSAHMGLADTYFAWGGSLKEEKEFQNSIEKYTVVLEEYPDSSAANQTPTQMAESYLLLSDQLWKSGEFQTAIEKARISLSDYPSTPSGKNAANQIAGIYYDWAADLHEQGEYQEAIYKIHTVREKYPDAKAGEEADSLVAEIYADWAEELIEAGSFQSGVMKFKILLSEYADVISNEEVNENLKSAYFAWAEDCRADGDYKKAISKYRTLRVDFSDTVDEDEINQLMLETKLEWGYKLVRQDAFTDAMALFSEVEEDATGSDLDEEAQEGYEEALWGLSQDKGSEGEQVMEEALDEVCDGDPASSPAVGLAENEAGKALACSSMYSLPSDLQASHPGHLKYVVTRQEGAQTIETCSYTGGHTLYRKQKYWTISVGRTDNGKFFSKTFYGSMPAGCQQTERFWGKTKTKYGSDPSVKEINAWLGMAIE
ncbi:MAG: outer membrane protein assembly factor BamD [Anaerolineales bacterium]